MIQPPCVSVRFRRFICHLLCSFHVPTINGIHVSSVGFSGNGKFGIDVRFRFRSRPISILKRFTHSFKFSCFFASCGRKFAKVLDFIENLLEDVSILNGQLSDKVGIGKDVVTNEIGSKFAINVGILYILVK